MTPHPRVAPAAQAPLRRVVVEIDGRRHELALPADLLAAHPIETAPPDSSASQDPALLTVPVSGRLSLWKLADGSRVEEGQTIAVIEAMKMETAIEAHRSGILTRLAEADQMLDFGAPLARIAAER